MFFQPRIEWMERNSPWILTIQGPDQRVSENVLADAI